MCTGHCCSGTRMGESTANSLGNFSALPQFPQAHPVSLATLRGRAEICPQVSQACQECMGHVLCPHCGVCQPLLCPTGCLPVCPGRKGLTCPDFLSAVLEGKVTCRREWREGDLQNCFARHVLGVGKALSEAEPQIQLEFGLSGQNLSAEVTPFSCRLPDLFTTSLCHCRGGPGAATCPR